MVIENGTFQYPPHAIKHKYVIEEFTRLQELMKYAPMADKRKIEYQAVCNELNRLNLEFVRWNGCNISELRKFTKDDEELAHCLIRKVASPDTGEPLAEIEGEDFFHNYHWEHICASMKTLYFSYLTTK